MKSFLLFTCLLLTVLLPAQQSDSLHKQALIDPEIPEFPGGFKAMRQYLDVNIKDKMTARETGLKSPDTVVASFVLDETGKVTQPKIIYSSGSPLLDSLFLTALKAMPRWHMPTINGKATPQKFNLPYTVSHR